MSAYLRGCSSRRRRPGTKQGLQCRPRKAGSPFCTKMYAPANANDAEVAAAVHSVDLSRLFNNEDLALKGSLHRLRLHHNKIHGGMDLTKWKLKSHWDELFSPHLSPPT